MKICTFCKNLSESKVYLKLPDIKLKKTYTIHQCSVCNVKKTIDVQEDINEFYNKNPYNGPQPKLLTYLRSFLFKIEVNRIKKYTKSNLFLDIGSGNGLFSRILSENGCNVVAADAFSEKPYYIKSLPKTKYVKFNYDITEIENPDIIKNRVIILRHVLEHTKNPENFLNQFKKLNASFVYISVPNCNRFEGKIFQKYDVLWGVPLHLWHFEKKSLALLAERIGGEVIACGYDTIPTISYNILRFMEIKKYPKILQNIMKINIINIPLSLLLNVFFPNNVIWMIIKLQ